MGHKAEFIAGKKDLLNEETRGKIDHWISKFPVENKRSALIQALIAAQDQNGGWLTLELMDAVAEYLELAPIAVYEVATFYSMYDRAEVGKHKINVCTNISCQLCGSSEVMQQLQDKLGIKAGETTPDGLITLREVECLAACGAAPMMQVDKTYHENLTPESIDKVLAEMGWSVGNG
jgi:NADH-quinone oxidoreductase subunit E